MIVVDVGANRGDLALDICAKNLDIKFFAVEPNYVLFENQLKALEKSFIGKFQYIPTALSDFNGTAKLYAPRHMHGQVASLLRINNDNAWGESIKNSFSRDKLEDNIEVKVLSVQKFLSDYKITEIDFLKIDVQGTDLLILNEFLVNSVVRVAAVEIEVSPFGLNSHYKDANNSFHDLLEIMKTTGYEIIKIMPANSDCHEYNVFIAQSFEAYQRVNQELVFEKLQIFSRFWKVLGIGNDSGKDLKTLQFLLMRKLFIAVLHPISSYKSLLTKLTS